MKVNKELIEKYHQGICTAEEVEAVERWLLDDGPDEELVLPVGKSYDQLENEIWAGIKPVDQKLDQPAPVEKSWRIQPLWRVAAAAMAIFVLSFAIYGVISKPQKNDIVVLNNSSKTNNKDLSDARFNISLAPQSNIEIHNKTGQMDFCGAVLIQAKEDLELTIQGTCSNDQEPMEKMTLKKGQNYIALNYGNQEDNQEVIILEEGSMMGLPPIMKRQIMQQFNI